ncbi:MAG: ATP-dependent sacrificial sulfur transferase LarE [Desulfobacterales bacterium]|nr:ATP-dependent sacrificial sulfur transferase LarE [Desulfobacterales bacterium]
MVDIIDEKFERLKEIIRDMGSVLVAFSGGVDSTFLLKVAHDELRDKVLALTGVSATYPEHEFEDAKKLTSEIGVRHLIVPTNELDMPDFYKNTRRRCYYCKKELFGICKKKAKDFQLDWVVDGTNYADREDFRPGMEAAREIGIRSPLFEAMFTKDEIRILSRKLHLSIWDKPSFACLSSRFPYGTKITYELLNKVGECEKFLRVMGFKQFRVRYHKEIARIEVDLQEMPRFYDKNTMLKIITKFKELGFTYITLDLEGYRTGKMNEGSKKDR